MDNQIWLQSIPNFSEGRDLKKVEQIVDAFRGKTGVKLLDYSTDSEHNRCVVTVVGQPEPLQNAMIDAIGKSIELIDMNHHEGLHPRIGCADVVPFIPVRNATIKDAYALAKAVANEVASRYGQPFYFYEESATVPFRKEIVNIRKGQFEGLTEKMRDPMWKPDVGPDTPHPTGGATVIGARQPIIFYNVNLDTTNPEIAKQIARRVRNISGGLHCVKALGVTPEGHPWSQVSMNLTDYSKSSIYSAFELVKIEAARYGTRVISSELVGFVPIMALLDSAEYYLQLEDFNIEQVLEFNL